MDYIDILSDRIECRTEDGELRARYIDETDVADDDTSTEEQVPRRRVGK